MFVDFYNFIFTIFLDKLKNRLWSKARLEHLYLSLETTHTSFEPNPQLSNIYTRYGTQVHFFNWTAQISTKISFSGTKLRSVERIHIPVRTTRGTAFRSTERSFVLWNDVAFLCAPNSVHERRVRFRSVDSSVGRAEDCRVADILRSLVRIRFDGMFCILFAKFENNKIITLFPCPYTETV